ncbi:hypothetical protein EV426DRAFT_642044, partial [Tirmania nivea]
MPPPRILPRAPARLFTTFLTTSASGQQHCSRTIYTSPGAALYQYLSRQPRLPSIAPLSVSGRRWASVGGRVGRYELPTREERARAAGERAAGERAAGEKAAGEKAAGEKAAGKRAAGERDSAPVARLVPSAAVASESVGVYTPSPAWSGGGGGAGFGDGGGGAAQRGGRGSTSAGVREGDARGGSDRAGGRNIDDAARYTGPRRRLPNPAPPPSKKPSTLHSETHIPHLSHDELGSVFSQELFVFRCDVTAALMSSAMSAYPRLKSLSLLLPSDISNLARQLHNRFRQDHSPSAILPHLKILMTDLQSAAIPGHPLASVHILSCLKDMSEFPLAICFWDWLKHQSTEHTDARVYGAIIEALAFIGEPLPVLEKLYDEAFQRYSNNSHISPTLARETGATHIMLLQGIITARVLNGEWRSAYKALDLILRLYPTATPNRVYELFIYERPIPEAFTVFLLACRAGTPPKPGVLTTLLTEIWNCHRDPASMIRACWAFAGAGGRLMKEHLNSLIKGLLLSWPYPPRPPAGSEKPGGGQEVGVDVAPSSTPQPTTTTTASSSTSSPSPSTPSSSFDTLLNSIRALIAAFRGQNILIDSSTFNTLITCGGKLSRGDLVLCGLRDMLTLNIRPNDITFRSLVIVSANLEDPVQLKASWEMIVKSRHELRDQHVSEQRARDVEKINTKVPWDFKDWQALVSSSYSLGEVAFARAELEKFKDSMDPNLYTQVWGYFAQAQERELAKKRQDGNYYGGTPDKNTPPNLLHATFNLEKIILEVTRLLQTLRSPTVIPFSPPEASSSGSTTAPSPESNSTTSPPHSPKATASKLIKSDPRSYFEIDMYLTSPSHPPFPTPRLQEIYNQLLSTSPSPYSGQSPRYLGPGINNDAHNRSTTGYTLRELRFQNWVTVNRLLFEAELHEHRIEAKVRRDMIENGSSVSAEIAKPIMWKDEQIRERVRRAEEKAREQLANGEDVDVDVKSGRVVRRNERTMDEVMKGVREEEWEIRKLLGGGGWTWESEGKAIAPEMFDRREGLGVAEKPVSAKESQLVEEKKAEEKEKNPAGKKEEAKMKKVGAAQELEKPTPKTPTSSEVTPKHPTSPTPFSLTSPKTTTTPSTPAPLKPISPASAPDLTQVSASPKPSAPTVIPISPPSGKSPEPSSLRHREAPAPKPVKATLEQIPIAATIGASAKSEALGPPWPTVPFIPKHKASPIEELEESKAAKSEVKAVPIEKAGEDITALGGPWPTVPFVPRTEALPEEITKEVKEIKKEAKKETTKEAKKEAKEAKKAAKKEAKEAQKAAKKEAKEVKKEAKEAKKEAKK